MYLQNTCAFLTHLLALVFGYDSPRVAAAAPTAPPKLLHRKSVVGVISHQVALHTQTSNSKELNSIEQVM
jgi:hypothetical protein